MADARDGFKYEQGADAKNRAKNDEQSSAFADLEAGADDVEKVKGGARARASADPCEGGE